MRNLNLIAGIALILCTTVASADMACDGSQVADLTTATLRYAETCVATIDAAGAFIAAQSVECQIARVESAAQYAAVQGLVARGCTSYYAGPSHAQLNRMNEISYKLSIVGK